MLQLLTFSIIFGCMVFIWSFVFMNRSHDKVNQSFLWFLSVIIVWIVRLLARKLPPDLLDEIHDALDDCYPPGEIRRAIPVGVPASLSRQINPPGVAITQNPSRKG